MHVKHISLHLRNIYTTRLSALAGVGSSRLALYVYSYYNQPMFCSMFMYYSPRCHPLNYNLKAVSLFWEANYSKMFKQPIWVTAVTSLCLRRILQTPNRKTSSPYTYSRLCDGPLDIYTLSALEDSLPRFLSCSQPPPPYPLPPHTHIYI